MCQCKIIFVMEISKVKKPLHVHFYPNYEIRYSAVSGLHVKFAADVVQPIACLLYFWLIYRHGLDNRWKVDGSITCMYSDTASHVAFSCAYLCGNVIQYGNVIRWDRRILKMYECLSSGTRLLQNSVNKIFNRVVLKFLYTFWYFYFIKCK